MTREDRLEVVEIVTESMKVFSRELNSQFDQKLEKTMEKTKELITELSNEMDKRFKAQEEANVRLIRQTLVEQMDRFIEYMKPYEQRSEKHERYFNDIKDSLTKNENEEQE